MRRPDGGAAGVVILADGVFDAGTRYTPQRMAAALARTRPVLYVEPPYAARALLLRPRAAALGRPRPAGGNLSVLTVPVPLPDRARHSALLRRLARAAELRCLRAALETVGIRRFVVWAYAPHDAPLLEALGADAAVFEYKDEIASFPAYARGRRAGALRRLEAEMLGRCDLVFAPTEALARRKRGMHPRVRVARFGVDLDHFAEARRAGTPIPEDVARLPRPIAGYVGALDRYKLDFALLRAAAEASPGVTFVLVGPAGVTDGTSAAELPRLPNVVHLGPRPYADLPAYLGAFDVCLVPHRVDGYSETNLPFKVLEYLAAGRPVVATDMPALRELGAAVRRASGPRAFVEAIHRCLAEGDPPAPDPGALWSWEARARWMLDALEEVAGPARSGGGGP